MKSFQHLRCEENFVISIPCPVGSPVSPPIFLWIPDNLCSPAHFWVWVLGSSSSFFSPALEEGTFILPCKHLSSRFFLTLGLHLLWPKLGCCSFTLPNHFCSHSTDTVMGAWLTAVKEEALSRTRSLHSDSRLVWLFLMTWGNAGAASGHLYSEFSLATLAHKHCMASFPHGRHPPTGLFNLELPLSLLPSHWIPVLPFF